MIEVTSYLWEHGLFIAAVSMGVTAFSTAVRYFTLDKEKLKEHKEKLAHHKEQIKKAQKNNDIKAMQKHQGKMLEVTKEQAMTGMRPMMFTFIPIILIFGFLRGSYDDLGAMQNITISEALPPAAMLANISEVQETWLNTSFEYDKGKNMAVFRIQRLPHTMYWTQLSHWSGGKANVTFEYEGEFDFKPVPTVVGYTLFHSAPETHRISQDGGQGDSKLIVTKSQYQVDGNKVTYTIDYENTDRYEFIKILGVRFGWLGFYILCSFPTSMILSKVLGLR